MSMIKSEPNHFKHMTIQNQSVRILPQVASRRTHLIAIKNGGGCNNKTLSGYQDLDVPIQFR